MNVKSDSKIIKDDYMYFVAEQISAVYMGEKFKNKVRRINENFISRKFVEIREFERMIFETQYVIEEGAEKEMINEDYPPLTLEKGIILLNKKIIYTQNTRKICIALQNLNPYRCRIDRGEIIGKASISQNNINFQQKFRS